ncbi:MAG: GTP-binding protein [Planctomycetia bacterium]|nr:GTP-binding protein [Planctomycetia bacterium]
MHSVPTNLITGFLGVGKTTAVIDLLKRKAPGSRWAVLVNEYGSVTIDGAMIEGSGPEGVTVKEVGGGCVCCAAAPFLPVAIHFLLLDARPERLLIETTGLGHPARLLDALRMNYHGRLDVRATLGIVDPADFAKPEMLENPIFVDQIQMADVLVMNKLDTATPELVADFQKWANSLFPPKLLIAGTTHGRIDPAWLDLSSNDERRALYPEEHAIKGSGGRKPPDATKNQGAYAPRSPVRFATPSGVRPACGWIFDPADVFDEAKLLALLANTNEITRLKGVFHLPGEWASVNRVGTAVSVAPTAYRRDSRLEMFADGLDWDAFERALVECLLTSHGD